MHLLNRSVPLKIENNILNLILDSLVVSCVFFLCVCMCVCVYPHICIYACVCLQAYVCIYACIHFVCVCACVCVCVCERGDVLTLPVNNWVATSIVAHIGSRLQSFQLFDN